MSADTHDSTPRERTDDNQSGLSWSRNDIINAAATVDAGKHAPTDLYQEIVTSDGFQRDLIDAVRELLAGTHRREWTSILDKAGVTARDGRYAQLVAWLDRPPESDEHQAALDYTAALGQGQVTVFGEYPTFDELLEADLVDGPLALLDAVDTHPTISVRLGEAFRQRSREQREDALSLLVEFARVCDVRLVGGRISAHWLAENHRSHLPAEFVERHKTGCGERPATEEIVDEALTTLDPDGSAVELLRALADEPSETVAQASLRATLQRDASTVTQLLNKLEGLNLVERFSVGAGNHVELLPTGSAYLDRLDAEIGRQAELDRQFGDTPKSHQRPCKQARGMEGEVTEAVTQPLAATATAPYRTRFLGRADHAAAMATATSGGVTAVAAPTPDVDGAEDRHTRFVSYDADRDEAVVAVRATTPLQFVASVSMSLASPRLIDQALPPNRLDDLDPSSRILRDARCIGGLSAEAENDPAELRDALVEWGEKIASMTTDLHRGEYEDRDRFRGEIMRAAHGLAGTVVHLLDVAGVDVVRELRLPNSPTDDDLAAIAETVTVATAIQSRYGHYAAYRQLYEDREEKRQSALSPDVDADDPFGTYIGGLVIRGPKAHRLGQHIEGQLAAPTVHEDAPEISIRLQVTTPDRTTYAETVSRMGSVKNLRSTREAVTLYRTLAGSPFAVADAMHWLGTEDRPRDIRLDEVRVTLSRLNPSRLLPETPPSVPKMLGALLRTVRPLSKTRLAEKAGVSPQSVRNHLDVLEALDLIRVTDQGLRLALPFATDEKRGRKILPGPVDADHISAQELLFDVALEFVDAADAGRLGDPDDPLGAVFCGARMHSEPLRTELPDLWPWVDVARALCSEPDPPGSTVAFGAEIEQTSLQAPASGGGAA